MVSFIDARRGLHGVEPICGVLPIAPSTYYSHLAKRADPMRQSDRARRDEALLPEIRSCAYSRRTGASTVAETINGLFKAEVIHRRGPWRSIEAVEYATLEWVDWFNNRRLLEPIGNIPPSEAEANFYAALETEVMAA